MKDFEFGCLTLEKGQGPYFTVSHFLRHLLSQQSVTSHFVITVTLSYT